MDKILITYNICGIKRDNTEGYIEFLKAIDRQKFDGEKKVVVSACKPRPRTIPILKDRFPNFDYIQNDHDYPVNVTFNDAVLKSVGKHGKFNAYVYTACDALYTNENQIQGLFNLGKQDDIGMVSAQIDQDSCYAYGLKLGGGRFFIDDEAARYEMFKDGKDYAVPPGRACGAHVNLYTDKLFDFYGRCCPDIFAGYCTESVFSFLSSALKLKWIVSKDFLINHFPGYDGPSLSTNPEGHKVLNPHTGSYDHPFRLKTLLPIFFNEYAKSIGLGYEECQNIVNHDPSQFDENYYCVNDKLKQYIKENLFLNKDLLDYNKIESFYV